MRPTSALLAALALAGAARADLACGDADAEAPGEVLTGRPLRHTFVLRNTGPATVAVVALKPGCGCLAPTIDSHTLSPGGSASVTVEVNTVTQPAGRNRWVVAVLYRDGGREKELPLTLSADVRQLVSIVPANLVIHTAGPFTHRVALVERTPSPLRLASAETTSPHVRATAGEPARASEGWRREVALEVLPSCPDGRLEGVLRLRPEGAAGLDLRFPFTVEKRSRAAVSAAPATARLTAGGAARIVLLSGAGPVRVERAEATDPAVSVTWAAGPGDRATLRLRAARGAAGGRVRVGLAGGGAVEVPVVVE